MDTLFPLDPLYPGGFQYRENFITPAEEAGLLKLIATIPLHTFQFQGYEAKRRVAGFGETADFAELLVTKYPPGSVINWHLDAPPFELIAGISPAADCIFKLKQIAL